MIKLFEKRGKWCYRDENNKIHKFDTKEEAMYSGQALWGCPECDCDPCECDELVWDEDEDDES